VLRKAGGAGSEKKAERCAIVKKKIQPRRPLSKKQMSISISGGAMIKKHGQMKWQAGFLGLTLLAALGGNAQTVSWKSTTAQNPWVDKGTVAVTTWDNDQTLYIEVNDATKYQTIDGWGGAINEYGWVAMSVLSQAERDNVMKSLFDTSGCAFNLGRISMGANDYSVTFNSNDDSPNDYSMSNFSFARDSANIIPFALAAKAINPVLKFWGTPHSPPAWMKQNNNMVDGSLKTDDATRKAWALYFQKWVEGMNAKGIPIYSVHIQNEPNITGVGYPSCAMTGAEMGTLIKNYLGPQFKSAGLATEIWVGTLHSTPPPTYGDFYPSYIPPTLGDAAVNALVTGVSMQWNAIGSADQVVKNYPSKKTMQSEAQCGNFNWATGYNPDVAPNDWAYGVFTVHRMIQWMRLGVNSYFQWNMVLDEAGKSHTVTTPWPQNSMVSINKTTKVVRYNPQFYAVKHFTYYVKAGASRIATAGNYSTGGSNLLSQNLGENVTDGDMMAFLNPNGDRVLVVRNSTGSNKAVAIKIGTSKIKPTIPANSFNTFLIANPVAVRNQATNAVKVHNVSVLVNSGSVRLIIQTPAGSAARPGLVSIMDAAGKVVQAIRVTALTTDRLSVEWNGKNENGERVVPGVYFVRVSFGNKSTIRKFALSW
jgi:glucosylceramidase